MEQSSPLPGTACHRCVETATVAAPFIQLCKNTNQQWAEISDYLLNLHNIISRTAKSALICVDTDEIKIFEYKKNVVNKKKAHKLIRRTFCTRETNCTPITTERETKEIDSDMQCPECGKAYPNIYTLNAHLKDIDKKMCYYCKQIIDIDKFAKHLAKHGAVLFPCKTCKRMLKTRSNYIRHVKLCKRKGKQVCVECSRRFASESTLVTHYSSKHNPKICAACDRKFMSKVCFHNHKKYCINSKAVPEKYTCDYCLKEFKRKTELRVHIRFIHVLGWGYQCEQCGKKFANSTHLREHDNIHNKVEDRYVCSVCNKKYSTRRGYERHSKGHHENGQLTEVSIPYPNKKKRALNKRCMLCDYATANRQKLDKHLSSKHNILQWETIQE